MTLRCLVVEGNSAEGRAAYRIGFGRTAGESYAETLRWLAPDATCEILCAADAGAEAAPSDYDAVFITGSSLNLYDGGPEIARQVELARVLFRSGVPFFGSCWGLQVAAAASGGEVVRNPRGREVGVARGIWLTEAGRRHPMLTGRAPAYDALCTHLDIVTLPPGGVILAANLMAPVQAAEIVHDGGTFWGVQYHPEYAFAEVAAICDRRAAALAREGFAQDEATVRAYVAALRSLDESPAAGWRLGIGESLLTRQERTRELANFIAARVRPEAARRGRG